MAEKTEISWTDHTWSPVWGCTEVSKAETGGGGCDNCYARTLAHRFGYGWNGAPMREFGEHHWTEPVRWNRRAQAAGTRPRVFPSMCDPLDKDWPDSVRERFWRLVEATPYLTWLILTKRIGNYERLGPGKIIGRHPANVWLGATVVNQAEADRDIPKLLEVPAAVRFLSIEPMLGPIDLTRIVLHSGPIELAETAPPEWHKVKTINVVQNALKPGKRSGSRVDWIIAGGESGPRARPTPVPWLRSIVQQCKAAGVPVHIKQLGAQPRDWCAARVHASPEDDADCDDDYCDLYEAHECGQPCPGRCAMLEHKKGGDPAEWPEELRVQEFPIAEQAGKGA